VLIFEINQRLCGGCEAAERLVCGEGVGFAANERRVLVGSVALRAPRGWLRVALVAQKRASLQING